MTFLLPQLSSSQSVPSAAASLEQDTALSSKARNFEDIPSDEQAKTQMAAKSLPVLPDSIYVQSIFPSLKLDEVRDIRLVSKTVKNQAIHSLKFRSEASWSWVEIKDFLRCGGNIKELTNVKGIGGKGYYDVTDDDIEQICQLPNLEEIDLSQCEKLTDRAYIALGKHASKLTSCDGSYTYVTSAGIEALAMGCKNLSRIKLKECNLLDDEAFNALGKHASELTECDVSGCKMRFTNAGVEALATGCKKLSKINLNNSSNIDDRALIALGTHASELTNCLVAFTGISNAGVIALLKGCKKLSELDLSLCNIDDDALMTTEDYALALTKCNTSATDITKEAQDRFNAIRKELVIFTMG